MGWKEIMINHLMVFFISLFIFDIFNKLLCLIYNIIVIIKKFQLKFSNDIIYILIALKF